MCTHDINRRLDSPATQPPRSPPNPSSSPSLTTIAPDALFLILSHLSPADLASLNAALPSTSHAARLTAHPNLWRALYRRHFPPATGPHPHPQLAVRDGHLDWRAAYWEAHRRRDAVRRSSRPPPSSSSPSPSHSNPSALRVQVRGNVRRFISATADRHAANVIWDHNIAAARFDWTGRQPTLAHRPPPNRFHSPPSPTAPPIPLTPPSPRRLGHSSPQQPPPMTPHQLPPSRQTKISPSQTNSSSPNHEPSSRSRNSHDQSES